MRQPGRNFPISFLLLLVLLSFANPGCMDVATAVETPSPNVESKQAALTTGVLVYLREEGLTSSNESKPRIYVKNTTANALRNLSLSYYFTSNPGKTPVLEDWYTPGCDLRLEPLGGLSFRIRFLCPSVVLQPGQAMPDTVGYAVGLHHSDWSAWNRTDDYSYNASATHALTNRVVVESGGTVLAGTPPPPPVPPSPLPLAWQQTVGGAKDDFAEDAIEPFGGGLLLAGWTNSMGNTPGTYDDAWLAKTDVFGQTVWQQTFGGASYDRFNSVIQTEVGHLVAVGYTNSNDIFMVRLDPSARFLYQKIYAGPRVEEGLAVCETRRDNGLAIVGNSRWSVGPSTYSQMLVMRTDLDGNHLWTKTFGSTSAWSAAYSVASCTDNESIVVAGEENGLAVVKRLNKNGDVEWSRTFDAGIAKSVLPDPDYGYYVLGQGPGPDGGTRMWLVKTDNDGALIWIRMFDSPFDEVPVKLRRSKQGTYLVLGRQVVPHTATTLATSYPRLLEVDDAGVPLWSHQFNYGSLHVGNAVVAPARGGYVVAGYTAGTGSDAWLAKLGSEKLIDVEIPPLFYWCDQMCMLLPGPTVDVCPGSNPTCTPTRSTTLVVTVNGRRINAHHMNIDSPIGKPLLPRIAQQGASYTTIRAYGYVTEWASEVTLRSDEEILLPGGVPVVWGGTTTIDIVANGLEGAEMNAYYFRHASNDAGDAALAMLQDNTPIITQEKAIAQVTTAHPKAFFLPYMLATIHGASGFNSFGDGKMGINTDIGYAGWELAHEYGHELQRASGTSFDCLTEGVADYLGNFIGVIPDSDLPIKGDCQAETGIHAIGECYLSHVKQEGLLDAAFLRGLFHPQHTYKFNGCDAKSRVTGDTLVVMFSEAAGGRDMTPVVTKMNVPNSGSYAAAKAALGF